jgi:predicted nuclease of predicted toxin-antitoxin system
VKPKLYLDEGIYSRLARTLRDRGVDALSFAEAGHQGAMDVDQLDAAVREQRAIVTYDRKHFLELASQYFTKDAQHWGIIITPI